MLATIARLIDVGLADTREQYPTTLLEARPKPWVLDGALVAPLTARGPASHAPAARPL